MEKKVNKIVVTDADKSETTQYFDVNTKFLVRTVSRRLSWVKSQNKRWT
jgi:hypothetical protein